MIEKTLWLKDDRQIINTTDYEIFYNYTDRPIFVKEHTHDFYEALIFLSGKVDYVVEGKHYMLRPGDIILTNTLELHKPIINEGKAYERYVVWIHPNFIKKLSELNNSNLNVLDCFDSSSKNHYNLLRPDSNTFIAITAVLNNLLETTARNKQNIGDDILDKCYLTEFLVLLNQAYLSTTIVPDTNVISDQKINDIIYYINQNLCEQLSLDDLAKKFYISKFYLSRLFKEITGLTLHQYILKKRLAQAKFFMLNGQSPYNAAIEVGFNNYSHFSKCFKDNFSITPSDFIKLNK